jgi:membrane glycosyltransferase
VTWREAAAAYWPQTLFGIAVQAGLLAVAPAVVAWALPFTLGYVLAIPFAVVTASPDLGRWLARHRLCAIPEDIDPPAEVAACAAP